MVAGIGPDVHLVAGPEHRVAREVHRPAASDDDADPGALTERQPVDGLPGREGAVPNDEPPYAGRVVVDGAHGHAHPPRDERDERPLDDDRERTTTNTIP